VTAFTEDVDTALSSATNVTRAVLDSARKTPTITSVVITSSCISHYTPQIGKEMSPSIDDWNDDAVEMAHALEASHPMKGILTYVATKVKAEQEVWKWVKENQVSQP
jgi:nucleoside-diphosphate-sugar epimerase